MKGKGGCSSVGFEHNLRTAASYLCSSLFLNSRKEVITLCCRQEGGRSTVSTGPLMLTWTPVP